MTIKYIDPTVANGGAGTQANPYSPSDFATYFNALSGDQGGNSYLFRSGTFCRVPSNLGNSATTSNFTLGNYGTGAKPIIAFSKLITATWTLVTGTTWSIARSVVGSPYDFAFCYGGQSANGLISQSRPHGTRLVRADTLAHCEANQGTSYYDGSATIYVNLPNGQNPNNVAMEYTAFQYGLVLANTAGAITLDAFVLANAYDGNAKLGFAVGASGLTITDVESWQAGSIAATDIRSNFQIIGPTARLPGLTIERFNSLDSQGSGLDLLYVDGGIVHDLTIDNCGFGLGIWNDITNCIFSKFKITNIQPDSYLDTVVANLEHPGIYVPPSGAGVNGNSYRNRFSGGIVANTWYQGLYLQQGHGWIFENCAFIKTTATNTTLNRHAPIRAYVGNTGVNDPMEANFTNCLIVTPYGAYNLEFNTLTTAQLHGDKNCYVTTGNAASALNNTSTDSVTYASLATWRTFINTNFANAMDANSIYVPGDDLSATPLIKSYGTLIAGTFSLGTKNYLSGLDVTPPSIANGDAYDSQLVGLGTVIYTTANTAPTNGALTQSAAGALAATTYYVRCTWVGQNGETLASAETNLAVNINNVLNVAAPSSPPSWAMGWNVYVSNTAGGGSGKETKQNTIPIGTATAWVEPTSGLVAGAALPTIPLNGASPEDANGNPFEPNNMPCGAIQNIGLCAPSRQKRASGSW